MLGCDSVLAFDGEILGKPADAAEATRRWQRMRGRSGVLHTGHCLVDVAAGRRAEAVASTTVHFADVTDDEIAAYVATGEPLQVAGAFTIDGLGGPFVERIEGDPGTVVGLSLPLLRRLLAELDLRITDLWTKSRRAANRSSRSVTSGHDHQVDPAHRRAARLSGRTRLPAGRDRPGPGRGDPVGAAGARQHADRAGAGRVPDLPHPAARRRGRRSRSARSPGSPRWRSPAGCPRAGG